MRGVSQGVDSPEDDEGEANKPLSTSAVTISVEAACTVSVESIYTITPLCKFHQLLRVHMHKSVHSIAC
jgi:hypothetical protein